jgi:uncharacterized protein (DUF4415 family)
MMKDEYDFSTMKSRKNPYASKLKKPVTMRLSEDVITYFKKNGRRIRRALSEPYQFISARLHGKSQENRY